MLPRQYQYQVASPGAQPDAQDGANLVKGESIVVCSNVQTAGLIDKVINCRQYNAISVQVLAGGIASATVSVLGAQSEGGNYLDLPDPNATQDITANKNFDVVVGVPCVKLNIDDYVSGVFTIVVTPFVSPGQTRLAVTVTAESSGSGQYATATPTPVDVATGSTAALAANTNRLYALFVNDSDTPIYLALGAAAVVDEGIRLNQLGGAYEMTKKEGNLYSGAVNAIHGSTGVKRLLCLEGV
ncbi:MAG: hypothetical protein ACYC4L_11460 [Chloroflexota bacterium]